MAFSTSSKSRLTRHDLDRFTSKSLFDRIARAVCEAACLPRKELYEAWEVARRVRRLFRGGRVVDVAGGHGLLAQAMLLLDDSSPDAYVVDPAPPSSASKLHASLVAVWPRLAGRVHWTAAPLDAFVFNEADLIVSSHACGSLTDFVLERALEVRARVAVLPCCHDASTSDAGQITGWVDPALAIDLLRAVHLQNNGYHVRTQTIPEPITPKNRLLIGAPVTAGSA